MKARRKSNARRDAAVRRAWSEGATGRELARRYRLAPSTVSAIVAGIPRPHRCYEAREAPEAPAATPATGPAPPDAGGPAARPGARPAALLSTPTEPTDPADRLGSWSPRGSAHGHAKLDEAKVAELRRLRSLGWTTPALAGRFGVGRNTISYALNGRTWPHVPGAIPAKGGG